MQKPPERPSLAARIGGSTAGRSLSDAARNISLFDAVSGTILRGRASEFAGASVLVATRLQLEAALALIELDGLAEQILLAPPDLAEEHRRAIIEDARITGVVSEDIETWRSQGVRLVVSPEAPPVPNGRASNGKTCDTKWLMLTSGTTGRPKIVAHTLAGLTGAIGGDTASSEAPSIWATFYDIRRYGGLQILLRALIGSGSLVLSDPHETLVDHVARLIRCGVTHMSGTPSHWRKALMSDVFGGFNPGYVRLSGEIVDQAVLDNLRKTFPSAVIGHAYASTEAGVGFAVDDGLEGFPARLVGTAGPVEMKVVDGSLHIRSNRAALGYVGENAPALLDADGFVDSGDMVELRGDRYYFAGRRGGIINVGGLKVHPEEVEAAVNAHPSVLMSRAKARRSPITGAFVVAEVVLKTPNAAENESTLKSEIVATCRERLPPHKVPAMISFVASLEVSPNGKLVRQVG